MECANAAATGEALPSHINRPRTLLRWPLGGGATLSGNTRCVLGQAAHGFHPMARPGLAAKMLGINPETVQGLL
jgi:hypothetical protein